MLTSFSNCYLQDFISQKIFFYINGDFCGFLDQNFILSFFKTPTCHFLRNVLKIYFFSSKNRKVHRILVFFQILEKIYIERIVNTVLIRTFKELSKKTK